MKKKVPRTKVPFLQMARCKGSGTLESLKGYQTERGSPACTKKISLRPRCAACNRINAISFLRNFETLISLPLPFDVAVRAAVWSVQEQERPNYEGFSGGKSESPKMLHGLWAVEIAAAVAATPAQRPCRCRSGINPSRLSRTFTVAARIPKVPPQTHHGPRLRVFPCTPACTLRRFCQKVGRTTFTKPLFLLVPGDGFEPPTNGLQNRCSTTELTRLPL